MLPLMAGGAVLVDPPNSTGGRWDQSEKEAANGSINVLEIKAIHLGLMALCRDVQNTHILVKTDNTTAVAYVNHMGGSHSPSCNEAAREIWEWCQSQNNWLVATHIPGKHNVQADAESRVFTDGTEWKLFPKYFICGRFSTPDIDLFASRLNAQCKKYVSWRPDPGAIKIDAFCDDWGDYNCVYLFPPFSLLTRVIQKFIEDQAQGIMVAPNWPTEPWYPGTQG